jgi:hypothetical protein
MKIGENPGIPYLLEFKTINFIVIHLKNWWICLKIAHKVKNVLHRCFFLKTEGCELGSFYMWGCLTFE